MLNHKSTIAALSKELSVLKGRVITEVFSQDKGTLIICMSTPDDDIYLEICTEPPYDRILLKSNFNRAKKNSIDLFDFLLDQPVTNVTQVIEDRILGISLLKSDIYIILFGHAQSDLIITDKSSRVIDSFKGELKRRKKLKLENVGDKKLAVFPSDLSLFQALKKCEYYLGKYYSKEFINKYELDADKSLEEFNIDELQAKADEFYNMLCNSTNSYVYKLNEQKYLFSLIPLHDLTLYKEFDNISDGIRVKFVKESGNRKLYDLKKKFLKIIDRLIDKDQKAIERIRKLDLGEKKAKEYTHYAELLMSQPNPKETYGKKIELTDWDGTEITIKLKENLTLIENAQRYYKKASSVTKERKQTKRKLPEYEAELKELTELKETVINSDQIKEIENLIKQHRKIAGDLIMEPEHIKREDKFKKFELDEGYILYVGKNAKNNDELTQKFAKPNDIWLHARGVGGSHCVIRVDNKKPSKWIIKQAAAYAAYFSQAKTSKMAPVAYTEKKYVNKPKGANPGAVVMRREDVVMVEPKKPE